MTPDWSDTKAVSFAHCITQVGDDPERPGTTQLARAVLRLAARVKALTIDEGDRLILFAFAADRGAAKEWPATCEAIERVLGKYEVGR